MLEDLRYQVNPPLTRQALATLINRSPNYVLKAEALTFPQIPPSLLEFYTGPPLSYPKPLLISQYRDAQRLQRQRWLYKWQLAPLRRDEEVLLEGEEGPILVAGSGVNGNLIAGTGKDGGVGGREDFDGRNFGIKSWCLQSNNRINPTEYALSQGLCVPASAIYMLERNYPKKLPSSLKTALGDLLDYCESGEALGRTQLGEEEVNRLIDQLRFWLRSK